MRLSQADQSNVLAALRGLYAETDLGRLRECMLRLAVRLVGNEWASYNEFNRDNFRSVLNFRIPDTVEVTKWTPSLFAHIREHPAAKIIPSESLDVHAMSDFFPGHRFKRSAIFNEYYRHVGVEHQIFFSFDGGRGTGRTIAVNRKHRDFSERDRAVLGLLAPHFAQAYDNAVRLLRLRRAAAEASYVSMAVSEITVILRADHSVDSLSETARRWAEGHLESILDEGMLAPEPLRRWLRGEEEARHQPEALAGPRAPLEMAGMTGPITVHYVARDVHGRTILLLRSEPTESPVRVPDYPGLTRRENEVLKWITQGKNNPEIALILGLSVRTVYKHVENLFAKMGVESRAQAMVRALEARR